MNPATLTLNPTVTMCAALQPRLPGLGDSLAAFRECYGPELRLSNYRTDRFPPSYVFNHAGAALAVTPLPDAIAKVDVFFDEAPAEPVAQLLARFSARPDWSRRATTDPTFARHFALFEPEDERNAFYVATDAVALVQQNAGIGRLVLWIQTEDWPQLLVAYRSKVPPRA